MKAENLIGIINLTGAFINKPGTGTVQFFSSICNFSQYLQLLRFFTVGYCLKSRFPKCWRICNFFCLTANRDPVTSYFFYFPVGSEDAEFNIQAFSIP